VQLRVVRNGEWLVKQITPAPGQVTVYRTVEQPHATSLQRAIRDGWLQRKTSSPSSPSHR
jgi:hypothetical protein